jgi:hypothetical protein
MDKRLLKRPRLATDDLPSSKDIEKSLNKSLPKRGSGSRPSVQAAPLTEEAVAPVKAPASVPAVDRASNVESPGANPAGFEHGVRYGGQQVTHFNSLLVDDEEADARAEYRYQHQTQPAQPPVYAGQYTTAYPSARSSCFRASYGDSQRESLPSPSLDRIEAIMVRMECHQAAASSASTASSEQLQSLLTQGKFHSCLIWYVETCSFFSMGPGVCPPSVLMESVRAATSSSAVRSIWLGLGRRSG